jgi:hypothetical protein
MDTANRHRPTETIHDGMRCKRATWRFEDMGILGAFLKAGRGESSAVELTPVAEVLFDWLIDAIIAIRAANV